MNQIQLCELVEKKEIAPGIYDMLIGCDELAKMAQPGQFINIKCTNADDLLLRRPFSICDAYPEKGLTRFIFQIRGKGTEKLSEIEVGKKLNVLGPLGNSFTLDEKYESVILAGGGIGVFPMLFLLKRSKAKNKVLCIGYKDKDMIVLKDEFEYYSNELKIATDNGSYGHRGYVTELVSDSINENTDLIYTCGPKRMMAKIHNMCIENKVKGQFCLEERMGCGIGACLVCACKIKKKDSDDYEYKHVCKDGPIFWSNEVIFDEW